MLVNKEALQKIINEENYKSLDELYWYETEDQHKKRAKLQERLERQFRESHLSNFYKLIPNIKLSTGPFWYIWDYGVYNKHNELVALVDLYDGNFYIDKCDYEEFIKVPLEHACSINEVLTEGLKILRESVLESYMNISEFTIYSDHFIDSLEFMIKWLLPNYDEYVDKMFELSRSISFPFPHYSDNELIESYDQLCQMPCDDSNIALNTRVGDKIIQHFHPSIWKAHRGGDRSPYEAWQDDELIKKVIRNRVIFQPYINAYKICQGLNIMRAASKVSVFSAGRAKLIIHKYLNDYNTIFDPFSGYSGRLLGTISIGKHYIGQDININHINESCNILIFLRNHFKNINAELFNKNIFASSGKYPCLFTCSPYADKEIWDGTPESSLSCDKWINECLQRFDCERYVFVVDESTDYKDNIVETLNNKSHFGLNNEYVIVINR